ncbi:MAG: S8 family serine peptidase, partial [Caulobacterales bacterium]|nr:S8 family serine peptidase [Caulobacterales bacterium]
MPERDPRAASRRLAHRLAYLGTAALGAVAVACAPQEPQPDPDPDPIPVPDPTPPGDEPDIAGCVTIDSTAFANFQINRAEVLATLDGPDLPPGVLLKVREGQADALYGSAPMQRAGVTEMEPRSGDMFLVELAADADPGAFAEELEAFPALVEYAVPNITLYPSQVEPNDPCYAAQWHYWAREGDGPRVAEGGIDLPARWAETTGSADIVVAVIDTGIADNFDSRAANIVPGFDFISNAGNADDGDGRDPDPTDPGDLQQSFHGTHVAGTIGAATT